MAGFAARPRAEKVWDRVDRRGANECWPWTGTTNRAGYGLLVYTVPRGQGCASTRGSDRKCAGAHRVAYEAEHGEISAGVVVRHTCDNPGCCNPAHLVTDPPADNSADMVDRGRNGACLGRQPFRPRVSKLTDDDVRMIRALGAGEMGVMEIAVRMGISDTHVRSILSGRRKAHVPDGAVDMAKVPLLPKRLSPGTFTVERKGWAS